MACFSFISRPVQADWSITILRPDIFDELVTSRLCNSAGHQHPVGDKTIYVTRDPSSSEAKFLRRAGGDRTGKFLNVLEDVAPNARILLARHAVRQIEKLNPKRASHDPHENSSPCGRDHKSRNQIGFVQGLSHCGRTVEADLARCQLKAE